eukprot:681133-Pyramimonas_sp.AAC.1
MYEDLSVGIGLLVDAWLDIEALYDNLEKPAVQRQRRRLVTQHAPIWHGSGLRCESCFAAVKPGAQKPCRQQPAAFRNVLTQARTQQHVLHLGWIKGSGDMPAVFCTQCGGFTTWAKNAPKLCGLCPRSELRELRERR